MSNLESDQIIAFDTLYTSNHIQMLKILLPYLPQKQKYDIAIFIKYMELQYTIHCKEKSIKQINICSIEEKEHKIDLSEVISKLKPYCTENEKKQLEKVNEFTNMLHILQEFEKYKDILSSNSDINENIKQLLTPEQQSIFDMFQTTMDININDLVKEKT